mmetsp:Transcript_258/g.241  ORF Transcript_258/g.241 Transcript_258/m.241 type:complete len:200 (-) Transcript_258:62-661(-)
MLKLVKFPYNNNLFKVRRYLSHDLKYHSVEFKLHDLNGLNFYVHDSITLNKGQSSHHTCDTIHHHGQMGLKVRSDSHHATRETSDWFNSKVINGGALGLRVLNDVRLPNKLHFAFVGDLELNVGNDTYKIENIVLGQGAENGHNWWIGGAGKNFQKRHVYDANGNHSALFCKTSNADIYFTSSTTGAENCFAVTVLKHN